MVELTRQDRITACLYAGAVGDAMGAAYEGQVPPPHFQVPTVLRVTDDTQLTLATCEALILRGAVDPESIASRFVTWFRERRITGLGSSTLKALAELEAGGHWALVGASGERSAGNGAAMRIAPLAFFLDPDDAHDRQTIRDVCRITHRNDEAYVGALALLRTIRHVAAGHPLNRQFLSDLANALPDCRLTDRLLALQEDSVTLPSYASNFGTTGYVVDSVPCAILAALTCPDLLTLVREIVQCGGDTDTIASMGGQILGAWKGPEAVSSAWVDRLDIAPLLRDTALKLSEIAIWPTHDR